MNNTLIKNVESLKIKKDALEEISVMMEAYSEEGELYSEFGIDEDANLYRFEVEFENGYSCTININSGQCNCYIDYIVYDPNGRECSCIVGDGDLSNGDCIEFNIDDEQYVIKIEEI